jgi:hypothetical protein
LPLRERRWFTPVSTRATCRSSKLTAMPPTFWKRGTAGRAHPVDAVDAGCPELVADRREAEEGDGREGLVARLAAAPRLRPMRPEVEAPHLLAAHFDEAAVRAEVHQADRGGDAVGLPRLRGDAVDRVAVRVQRSPRPNTSLEPAVMYAEGVASCA